MSSTTTQIEASKRLAGLRRLGISVAVLLLLSTIVMVAGASAAYEQVGTFAGKPGAPAEPGVFPEEVQFAGVSGIAVNATGAGGVPAGTIYAMTDKYVSGRGTMVARYNPDRSFSEAWTVKGTAGTPYRCGPEGEPANPNCETRALSASEPNADVEVDQSTGDVYVETPKKENGAAEDGDVDIYSPDGSKLIAHFVVENSNAEAAATPTNPEHVTEPRGLAVAADGTVYLSDYNSSTFEHRVVVWKPETPGDYEHYVYTGVSHDIAAGGAGEGWPEHPVLDDAGNLYGFQEEAIFEYNPTQPSKPICKFLQPDGSIKAITVDPRDGEVFYFDYKNHKIHQLAPCNSNGEFKEAGAVAVTPPRKETDALGFDPSRSWAAGRPEGILYAGSAESEYPFTESSLGYIFAPPQEAPPTVSGEEVTKVTSTGALLQGRVDPDSVRTQYSFQYITAAAYEANPEGERFAGASEAPVGGVDVEGTESLPVSAEVSGLAPDTAYRYRLIASSHCSPGQPERLCEAVGADEELQTYPDEAAGLPDGRAYELVSPVDKQGGEVIPAYPQIGSCTECKPGSGDTLAPMQSAPNGESIVYDGTPFSHSEGAIKENSYYARRTASGWQTTPLNPANAQYGEQQGYLGFSRELDGGVLYQERSMTANAPSEYRNLYARHTTSSEGLEPLVLDTPPNRPAGKSSESFDIGYGGSSADFSKIFFTANDALTEATSTAPAAEYSASGSNLYESSDGQLRLVNVEPGNTEATAGAVFGASAEHDRSRVVSSDGSRVFWASAAGKSYVRIDGETTREIPDPTAHYETAAVDGSRVLMSDGKIFGHLEQETPTEEADLTEGKGGFLGLSGQSEDLSVIYFVDTAVLDETANARGAKAEAGKYNLYFWSGGAPRFIATLLIEDGAHSQGKDWQSSPLKRSAEASPDGQWLAFASKQELTGYDNVGPCKIASEGETKVGGEPTYTTEPCEEVFIYDAATNTVECASCNRTGARPLGNSVVTLDSLSPAELPRSFGEQPRYLTNAGKLFFDSADSLVPADTNGRVEDVYEYEPDETGSCERAVGCVSLISAGTGLSDSNLVTIDESGKNVFFTTRDQLVRVDKDDYMDLYDAREGGGIPAQSELAPGECEAEACQAPPAPSETATVGGSMTFTGAGNLVAPLVAPAITAGKPVVTRAQKLSKALRTCRKDKSKRKRALCEKQARQKYGAKPKAKAKSHKGSK